MSENQSLLPVHHIVLNLNLNKMSDKKTHTPHQSFHTQKIGSENLYRKQKKSMTKESVSKTQLWNNKAPKRTKPKS